MANLTNTNTEVPDVGGDSDAWGTINNNAHAAWDAMFQNNGTPPTYTPALRVTKGGTGANDAAGARTNLGLGAMALVADAANDGVAYVRKSLAWAALTWADIAGKPSTFAPAAHTHPSSEVTGLDAAIAAIGVDITALEADDVAIRAEMTKVVSVTKTAGYTFAVGDEGKIFYYNSASPGTFTIPANATAAIPVNTRIDLGQLGAGLLSIAPAGGVTLNSFDGMRDLAGQFAGATLHKIATNEWVLFGNLA